MAYAINNEREVMRMARPRKWKTVCEMPAVSEFVQTGMEAAQGPEVVITVEEYEVIRLLDRENLTQEECAAQMEVSRPTVQLLYNSARQKLADFLIDGGRLKIQGGVFRLCERQDGGCRRLDGRPGCCGRRRCEGNPTNDERPKEELR